MVSVGYCRSCRMAVELDERSRCPLHPRQRMEDIRRVRLQSSESEKADILLTRSRRLRKQLIGWLIAINSLLLLGYVLIFLVDF